MADAARPTPKPPFVDRPAAAAASAEQREDVSALTPLSAAAWENALRKCSPPYPADKLARLLDAIRHGVSIGYTGPRGRGRFARNAASTEQPGVVDKINAVFAADIAAGHKSGPHPTPPFDPFHVSPLGCVPKGDAGGVRLIHNLSHPFGGDSINSNIAREPYLMHRLQDAIAAIRRLGRGCQLSKFDVRHAFKLVPVCPADRPLLGIHWQGAFYYELVLPFGLRTSGYRWEEFAEALHYMCQHLLGISVVFHYVDDFLFVAPPGSGALAAQQRAQFERLCTALGVPIASEKTVGPATTVVFLGIELDSVAMECRLTAERVAKLRSRLQAWVEKDAQMSCDDLMSIVGKLEFATVVVPAGAAFLRRCRGVMMQWKEKRGIGSAKLRRLPEEAKEDLRWWLQVFLTTAVNRRSLLEPAWIHSQSPEMMLYTDACGKGYGARYRNHWFQGAWTEAQLEFARVHTAISMPYLELHALTHAAVVWGHLWRGQRIVFRCDAEAAVLAVQAMRSKKDSMSALLRRLYQASAEHGFEFHCEHYPGERNVIADALSRGCTLQELRRLLPEADEVMTPAPPLDGDQLPVIPWAERTHRPPRADSPRQTR